MKRNSKIITSVAILIFCLVTFLSLYSSDSFLSRGTQQKTSATTSDDFSNKNQNYSVLIAFVSGVILTLFVGFASWAVTILHKRAKKQQQEIAEIIEKTSREIGRAHV